MHSKNFNDELKKVINGYWPVEKRLTNHWSVSFSMSAATLL